MLSCSWITSQKKNYSRTVYSFNVNSLSIGANNFAMLYAQVPIADKTGRNGGTLFDAPLPLCTLQSPYIIPGMVLENYNLFLICNFSQGDYLDRIWCCLPGLRDTVNYWLSLCFLLNSIFSNLLVPARSSAIFLM